MDKTRIIPGKKLENQASDRPADPTVVKPRQSDTVVQKTLTAVADSVAGAVSGSQVARQARRKVTVGDCIKSRFDLLEILGVGGMGVVYRARDRRQKEFGDTEPYLALKVLSEQLQNNEAALVALQQECKKTQRLAHPNIVNVYDFDRDNDLVFMTMELLHGQSLDEIIYAADFEGAPLETIAPSLLQIANALQYAHDNGIVHSDFKPSNLFITQSGKVKIFDFGIARIVHQLDSATEVTRELAALTPAYASLGMLTDQPPHAGDDLYAFAVVTYFWLTGRHPYERKTALEAQQEGLVPARPRGLSDEAWQTLRTGLDPGRADSLTVSGFIDGLLPRPPLISRRLKTCLAVGGLSLLCMSGLSGYRAWQDYQVAQALASNDAGVIQGALERLDALADDRARTIIAGERGALTEHALAEAKRLESQQALYAALQYLNRFLALIPDSQKLFQHRRQLLAVMETREQELVDAIGNLESVLLRLTPDDARRWPELLALLAATSPENALLEEDRVARQLSALIHSQLFLGHGAAVNDILQDNFLLRTVPHKLEELTALAARYKADRINSGDSPVTPDTHRPRISKALEALPDFSETMDLETLQGLLTSLESVDREFVRAYRWALRARLQAEKASDPTRRDRLDPWIDGLSSQIEEPVNP
ncbi:MAG: serine/threonine-protein kinase [Ketobacteraceae bacterium]|nr:serine/threonine-protein kinase [Ketobacteraceae bacterium]